MLARWLQKWKRLPNESATSIIMFCGVEISHKISQVSLFISPNKTYALISSFLFFPQRKHASIQRNWSGFVRGNNGNPAAIKATMSPKISGIQLAFFVSSSDCTVT
jgi:hypothetical protein